MKNTPMAKKNLKKRRRMNLMSLIVYLQESKDYQDPVERLIYHLYRHMKRICAIDKIGVSSTLVKIEQELLKDETNRNKLQDNYDEYLALLQIKTLEEIYKISKFY